MQPEYRWTTKNVIFLVVSAYEKRAKLKEKKRTNKIYCKH